MARAALTRRYAQAAFEIALRADQLDRWRRDLERALPGLSAPELVAVLESPKVSLAEKLRLADLVMGDTLPAVRNLVHLLIDRERIASLDQVVAEYGRLMDAQRGIEHAVVTTAIPLDDQDKKNLAQRLKTMLNKEVLVASTVDPNIIGGLMVRIGDKLLDGSTRSQLLTLKRALTEGAG